MNSSSAPWKVSLHGGHSVTYCDHATGELREMLEMAVAKGLHTYGLAEHAPRFDPKFLYPDEIGMGWDIPKIIADFEAYARDTKELVEEFAGRLTVLRGFEAEIIPADGYRDIMLGLREKHEFDFMVGSVHYVDEILVDGWPETFERALRKRGDVENLAVAYYENVAEMVEALKPEIVGHFDVVRKFGAAHGPVDTPPIRRAAKAALEAAREHACILDCNTGGYRKGHGMPYPAPWIVEMAREMEVPFCFGDDSHTVDEVGADFEQAREYLVEHGVESVTFLSRGEDVGLVRETVSLG
jgi:histidinol-phosphatase (PHP family)